jgi:hypothetical protein
LPVSIGFARAQDLKRLVSHSLIGLERSHLFIGLLWRRLNGIEDLLNWLAGNKVSKGSGDSVAASSDRAQSSMIGSRLG